MEIDMEKLAQDLKEIKAMNKRWEVRLQALRALESNKNGKEERKMEVQN